jgi:nitric oxide reductase NorQ protein
MDYLPPAEEIKLLEGRHPELSKNLVELIVTCADKIRRSPELTVGLSVRATDEACIYLKHPLMEKEQHQMLPEVLKSSFCGRFSGRWDETSSDAGTAWTIIQEVTRDFKKHK